MQVIGPRKSGKTTLVEYLVRELLSIGVEPKVVKQTKHSLLETDSGDTRRIARAGAREIVLLCRDGIRVQKKGKVGLVELVKSLSGVVIVEGGKSVKERDWLAIVTWRNEIERMLYWKPLTVAEMGPHDDARIVAWRVARIVKAVWRARLS